MNETTAVQENESLIAIRKESNNFLDQSQKLADALVDEASFIEAGNFRVALNKARTDAKEKLEPMRVKSYAAYQEVMKLIKEVMTPFEASLSILDGSIGIYRDRQEQKRREEEEKARAEAKKQAEDAKLRVAEEADKSGDHARAEAILETPTMVVTPVTQTAAKVDGMSFRETWKVDPVINLKLLAQAACQGRIPLECVMPNMTVLNNMARALKQNLNIPGVQAVRERVVASKTK